MYNDLPAGQLGLCQMWSGDAVNAQYYLPKGTSADVLRYWFPADGRGMVDNDLMVVLTQGRTPVLAHLFINHMLDPEALENFGYIGYQPPHSVPRPGSTGRPTASSRRTWSTAIVEQEYFKRVTGLLELDADNDAAWHKVWQRVQGRRLTAAVASPASRPGNVGCPIWPLLALPGIVWLLLFFLAPLYVVLAIVFGQVDPMFRTPVPVWNPVHWDVWQFSYVLRHIVGSATASSVPRCCARWSTWPGQHPVPVDRVPGGLLRRPAGRSQARA